DSLLRKPIRQSLDDVDMSDFAVRAEDDYQSHVAFNPILSSRLGVFGLLHNNQLRLAHAVDACLPAVRISINVESEFQPALHADRFAVFVSRFELYFFRGDYGLFGQAEWKPANHLDDLDGAVFSENYAERDKPSNPRFTRLIRVTGLFSV